MPNLIEKLCERINRFSTEELEDTYNVLYENLANKFKSQIPNDIPAPMEFPCCGGYGFEWQTEKGICTMIICNKPVYSFVIDINHPENEYGYIADYNKVFDLVRKIV